MPFADDLNRFGPSASCALGLEDARAYCANLTATHYENFSVVTWLTPARLRPAFRAVYAFCRWSDDLGDEVGDRAEATRLLGWWRGELHEMFAGRAKHPVFLALAPIVAEFQIPIEPFAALISAFEQDQVVTHYETYAQLLDYCSRSANPVGHLVLYLARAFNNETAALSDHTCTGLQLANFWQDVARDLVIGRVYLPREDRDRFGVSEQDLQSPAASESFRRLLRFEVDRARGLLTDGRALLAHLPRDIAIDVDLFNRGGSAILDRIEAQDYDVLAKRPKLSKLAKTGLLVRSLLASLGRRGETAGAAPRSLASANAVQRAPGGGARP
jgi:squalene synthase HpnC